MQRELIQQVADKIPSWTSEAERMELIRLASEVREGGLIVEVGALYGGTTAVLSLAQPLARIIAVDNFSWSPIALLVASKDRLLANLAACGISNVEVIEGDSLIVGKKWKQSIDLLWIDGGHSYEFVRADLENFGPHAEVIALHDWNNPIWPSIRKAVEDFVSSHPEWRVHHAVEMVVELRRHVG